MLDDFRFRMRLSKLFRRREKYYILYANEIQKAKKEGKSSQDIALLKNEAFTEDDMISEEISILVTENLCIKA